MLLSLVFPKHIGKKKLQRETLCFFALGNRCRGSKICDFNSFFAQVHFLIICIKVRLIGVNLSLKGETFSWCERFLPVGIVLSLYEPQINIIDN